MRSRFAKCRGVRQRHSSKVARGVSNPKFENANLPFSPLHLHIYFFNNYKKNRKNRTGVKQALHERVEEEVLHGHHATPQEIVDHDPIVVDGKDRLEELRRDGYKGKMLNVGICSCMRVFDRTER